MSQENTTNLLFNKRQMSQYNDIVTTNVAMSFAYDNIFLDNFCLRILSIFYESWGS